MRKHYRGIQPQNGDKTNFMSETSRGENASIQDILQIRDCLSQSSLPGQKYYGCPPSSELYKLVNWQLQLRIKNP